MNSLEYLNQISVPLKSSATAPSLLDKINKKVALIVLGVLGALIFGLVIFSILKSRSLEIPELAPLNSLYLRIDSLSKTIETYNPKVKSPSLRSTGQSLSIILAKNRSELSSLLASDYGEEAATLTADNSLLDEIKEYETSLEKARLNGILDRNYASELAYQISVLLIYETSAASKTSNSSVDSFVKSSTSSLETLKSDLEAFSNL